jgi:hypothetical protein
VSLTVAAFGTDDRGLKQRYENLALEFPRDAGGKRDLDITAAPLFAVEPKPDSGNTG